MAEVGDVPFHALQGLDGLFAILANAPGKLNVILQDQDVAYVQADRLFQNAQVTHEAAPGADAREAIVLTGRHRLEKADFFMIEGKTVAREFLHRFDTAILSRRNIDDSGSIKIVGHIHPAIPQRR
ncbi:hypothetical protein D3C76_1153300 [compost metagenome]